MKAMKNRFKILFALMAAGVGALVGSCNDPGAEITDIPYNRVLTPLNFVAEVNPATGTDVAFSWSVMLNADFYTLEVYSDEGYSQLQGTYTVLPDEVPYIVTDLEVDTDYYARVKGGSESPRSGGWACCARPGDS